MAHETEFAEPASVLVVDDSPDNLSLMSGLLKDEYRVKVANNGARALKIAQSEHPPDLILLDIMMPEISGIDILRQMRRDQLPDIALGVGVDEILRRDRKTFDIGADNRSARRLHSHRMSARIFVTRNQIALVVIAMRTVLVVFAVVRTEIAEHDIKQSVRAERYGVGTVLALRLPGR